MALTLTVSLLLGAVALLVCVVLGRRRRRDGEPPLEQGWIPYLGLALEFTRDPQAFLLSCQQKNGDIFTVYLAGKYVTFILDPFLYQFVIQKNKQLDFQEFAMDLSSKVFGHPHLNDPKIPVSNEQLHKLYNYLQGKELNNLIESVMRNLNHRLNLEQLKSTEWKTDKLLDFCYRTMIEVSFASLYGTSPCDEQKQISELMQKFRKFDKMFPYLVAKIPIKLLWNTKRIREDLINYFISRELDGRLNMAFVIEKRKEFLEQHKYLQDHDIAAHHFALFWAAVGNTVPATFWAMYYLMKHPEAFTAVRDEIDHVLQSKDQGLAPVFNIRLSKEDLDSLINLGSAINETFRFCSASMNIRVSQEDFTLKFQEDRRIQLRKGDCVAIYPPLVHMDPEIYNHPEVYKFDRFMENGKEKTTFYKGDKKLRYYLMPFGSGSSMCPGRYFAINEIKIFITLILGIFDIEIVKEEKLIKQDINRAGLGILHPNSEVCFRYRLRQGRKI
ncbi:cytochrome P450 7B1 isoform X1 [Callorhinchus milii]|uniref:cytochrome P450 7B1 isoform X1 n=1 Tax=Callorhinchus milii TaxID=7868 RepID=UPI001C3FB065|nr:cytochrome P450 7B1 isoform X1 [Callorhinchus milii]